MFQLGKGLFDQIVPTLQHKDGYAALFFFKNEARKGNTTYLCQIKWPEEETKVMHFDASMSSAERGIFPRHWPWKKTFFL